MLRDFSVIIVVFLTFETSSASEIKAEAIFKVHMPSNLEREKDLVMEGRDLEGLGYWLRWWFCFQWSKCKPNPSNAKWNVSSNVLWSENVSQFVLPIVWENVSRRSQRFHMTQLCIFMVHKLELWYVILKLLHISYLFYIYIYINKKRLHIHITHLAFKML